MKRRRFLHELPAQAVAAASAYAALRGGARSMAAADNPNGWLESATAKDWQTRWEKFILTDSAKNRYCDTEMAEELGWLVSPFLDGFYYGYLATHDTK
jgi:hypothetical protein